jgi:hypothetical protein
MNPSAPGSRGRCPADAGHRGPVRSGRPCRTTDSSCGPLFLLVESHGGSFGPPLRGLHRAVEVQREADGPERPEAVQDPGPQEAPQASTLWAGGLFEDTTDGGHRGKPPEAQEALDQRIVPVVAAVLQFAKAQEQMNDQLQEHGGRMKHLPRLPGSKQRRSRFLRSMLAKNFWKRTNPAKDVRVWSSNRNSGIAWALLWTWDRDTSWGTSLFCALVCIVPKHRQGGPICPEQKPGISDDICGCDTGLLSDQDFTSGEIYESLHPVQIRGFSPMETAHPRDLSDYGMQSRPSPRSCPARPPAISADDSLIARLSSSA